MKRYSLANYQLTIEANDPSLASMFGSITIGGEGQHVGSVSFARTNNAFNTTSFATGAWVHNKNLSRVGTVSLSLNQLSNHIQTLMRMSDAFLTNDYDGFTLTLTSLTGEKVADAIDAYITRVPAQTFAESAEMQTWEFTCGKVNFNV